MKRDVRRQGLSSDHHTTLVLARSLATQAETGADAAGRTLETRFATELEPHFRSEEEVLLPALLVAGEVGLALRTADEHAMLRHAVATMSRGDGTALAAFAGQLVSHVRFEERERFPCCEQRLPGEVLDEVLRRTSRRVTC